MSLHLRYTHTHVSSSSRNDRASVGRWSSAASKHGLRNRRHFAVVASPTHAHAHAQRYATEPTDRSTAGPVAPSHGRFDSAHHTAQHMRNANRYSWKKASVIHQLDPFMCCHTTTRHSNPGEASQSAHTLHSTVSQWRETTQTDDTTLQYEISVTTMRGSRQTHRVS